MQYARLLSSFKHLKHPREMTTRSISLRNLFEEIPINLPETFEVKLTPEENQLCALLDECKTRLAAKDQVVECRISGGWVRDKLLGAQSNDIDVALANIMGVAFAEEFVELVVSKNLPVKTIATIARNPEQSKHLETARTTVLGIELDFVNLRSESYADDSRIPTEIAPGTPIEDALRRDSTINAMFYNVHSRSVEDLTGKGLADLREGLIRTPLSPFETFRDDPLRVIRCIRFASRFGFRMTTEVEDAMKMPEIKAAIVSKISRERIGEEVDKMMKGRDPLHSIRLLTDLGLQPSIFAVPQNVSATFEPPPIADESASGAAAILHALLFSQHETLKIPAPHPLLLSQLSIDTTLRPRLFLATAITPYLHTRYTPLKKQHTAPGVEPVIKEGLKLGVQNHYSDGVTALFLAAETLRGVNASQFEGLHERSRIGLFLRTKSVHNSATGSHWTSSLLFSLVQELRSDAWNTTSDDFNDETAANIMDRYNAFVSRVEELGLPSCIDDKPFLNGKEVQTLLRVKAPGPWTGEVLAKVSEWALDHPLGTKEDCKNWLKEEYDAGRIVIPIKSAPGKSPTKAKGSGVEVV